MRRRGRASAGSTGANRAHREPEDAAQLVEHTRRLYADIELRVGRDGDRAAPVPGHGRKLCVAGKASRVAEDPSARGVVAEDPQAGGVLAGSGGLGLASRNELELLLANRLGEQLAAAVAANEPVP